MLSENEKKEKLSSTSSLESAIESITAAYIIFSRLSRPVLKNVNVIVPTILCDFKKLNNVEKSNNDSKHGDICVELC